MANDQEQSRRMSAAEIESALLQFTGTTSYFRHFTNRLVYTEGVQFLAEAAAYTGSSTSWRRGQKSAKNRQ